MLLELMHQLVALPLESHHFLLSLLLIGCRQFQQCNISIFLADGGKQCLLPGDDKLHYDL